MNKPHAIHFVGIKGVGMAPLAVVAKEAGIAVTGSDIADGFITDAVLSHQAIPVAVGFNAAHVGEVDLVITTGAHGGYDNPEVVAAKKEGIPVLTQGEALGQFMQGEILGKKDVRGISVAGTHGKTTTTAMIATVLQHEGLAPSWVVGTSEIPSLGDGGHYGAGKYFVAEADEYATEPVYDKTPKFLWQHPDIAVITNVEHDHPDVYPTLSHVYDAFKKFTHTVSSEGLLVVCGDDEGVMEVVKTYAGKVVTYGFGISNEYQLKDVVNSNGTISCTLLHNGVALGTLSLSLSGTHSLLNATAAAIVGLSCGVPFSSIQKALTTFSGTKRRMEYIGQLPTGALLYDDYAHHPTEIRKTLQALREKYPDKKIVCFFQPHTFSRTKLLFEEFSSSFEATDEVCLTDIYPSQRESYDPTISSEMLVEAIKKQGKACELVHTLADMVKYIGYRHYDNSSVLITMGAGDIYTIASHILTGE